MKRLLLVALCCYISITAFAQPSVPSMAIKGVVIDSVNNKSVGFVTVALQDAKLHQPIKSTLSKDDGGFEIKAPAGKTYEIVLAFIGYKNKTVAVNGTGTEINVGKILLSPSVSQLKEVSVTAVRPIMKQEVDRLSYDVQADPESKAISALDMMRKVPLLSVDADDNIKLKGSGNYKILINGKESALMAKSPSDVLKAMPATNIEKIEVITTPPAKYDAEGLSGIINIITKKNTDQGYNGSINGRYNSLFGPGINLNGTVKEGKFGVSGYVGAGKQRDRHSQFSNTQTLFSDNSVLSQDGENVFGGDFRYGDVELSYEIDTLNLLTGSVDFFHGNFTQRSTQASMNVNGAGVTQESYNLASDGYNHDTGIDAAINYQLGFKKKKDELLTTSYKYSYSPGNNYADNVFSDRFNYYQATNPDFRQYNKAGSKEHTIQVDYVYPFTKVNLETGAKAILRNNFSNYTRANRDSATNVYSLDPNQSNIFNYHQDVYSFYNSYMIKFTKWTVKGGLRLEHTQVNADFSGTPLDEGYNNLIPSISLQRQLKGASVNFGFTQRIQRPGIYQLNPFVDRSNPKFVSSGNPNLRPEVNNTFELNFSKFGKGSVNAGLSYAFSNNAIQNVSSLRVDSVAGNKTDTVTYTTFQNLGSNKSLGLNVNANYPLTKHLQLNFNGRITEVWLKGTYNGDFYTNHGLTGNGFGSLAYKWDSGYRAEFDAGYFSGDVLLQGRNGHGTFYSFVGGKEFFDKKLTLSLVANLPFTDTRTFTSYTRTPDYYQTSSNNFPGRTFAIRVNYKFGKLNSEIKRNQKGINNDDTSGGNKNSGGNQ